MDQVTFKGAPLHLSGLKISIGMRAPDCELVKNDMSSLKLSSYFKDVTVIAAVPSLDTPVCDTMGHRLQKEVANFGRDVNVLLVSMDLPFAQARWCGAASANQVVTLSDYRQAAFGAAYGVLIQEWHLLARAVFVVDKQGVVRYVEVVKEITALPQWEPLLKAVREVAGQK